MPRIRVRGVRLKRNKWPVAIPLYDVRECPDCGGSGTVQVQKIVNGKVTQVSKPCPSGRCK